MKPDYFTVSLEGSHKVNGDIIRNRAKELGVTVSGYTQKLYEKDINSKKYENLRLYSILLIGFSIVILLLLFR